MSSRIRLLHGCPSFSNLDCFCGGTMLCQNIGFNGCSNYCDVDYGGCNISICPPKCAHQPLANAYTFIPQGSFHTAVFSGLRDNANMFVIPDGFNKISDNKAFLRFVNLAADAPCLDFRFTDGAFIIANDIRYKEVTQYYPVTPSTYQMQAMLCDTKFVVLQVPSITLSAGRSYTIYITGSARVHPYCSHILTIDGALDRPTTLPAYPHNDCHSCCGNDYFPNWDCCPPPASCGCHSSCTCTPGMICTPGVFCQQSPPSAPTIWEPCCCSHHDHHYHDSCDSCHSTHDFWNSSSYDNYHGGSSWSTSNGINYGSSYSHYYNDHC